MLPILMLLILVTFSIQQSSNSLSKSHNPRMKSSSNSHVHSPFPDAVEEKLVPGCKAFGQLEESKLRDDWTMFKSHLEDYTSFHHKQLQKLKSGTGDVRTLTWSCYNPASCRGIGDQLYNIQQTLLYAIISKRVLCLHWNPTSYKTMRYLQPNRIDWTFFNESQGMKTHHSKEQYRLGIPRTVEYYEPFYKQLLSDDHIHLTVNHKLQVPFIRGIRMAATSQTINKTLAQFGITTLLTNNSTSMPLEIFSGELLRYLFLFEKTVTDKVVQIQRQLGILSVPYMAIHLRTGFFGMEQDEGSHFHSRKAYRNPRDWEKTMACSIALARKLLGKNRSIYLATDSNVVKELATYKYGQRIKTANFTLQHVALTTHKPSQHVGKGLNKQTVILANGSKEVASVGGIDGYMATWVDFLLMARASALVHSISGFSVTAGQFCSIRNQYHVPNCAPRVKRKQKS